MLNNISYGQRIRRIQKPFNKSTYRTAYEYWITITLSSVDQEIEKNIYKANNVSMLEGWTGVAMVLADSLSEERKNWSKILLL
ncbi:MAG: hypothetical protein ACJ75B_12230 [Flavisolibacter sp.]